MSFPVFAGRLARACRGPWPASVRLLVLASARVQAALAAYRAGSGTLQAALDGRQAELALRLERVQIELETASEWARLNTLIPQPESAR